MAEQMREPIQLTDEQVEQLHRTTQGGTADYPAGYELIYRWIKDNPAAQQDGTVFWFEQARGINGDDSLSARFIRRHTDNGLDITDVPQSQRLDMQELSNLIAERVTTDVLAKGEVAALPEILERDISIALDRGQVSLGGWGGSFYYWDMPFKNPDDKGWPRHMDGSYKTVGDEIIRRGERDLLIETSSRTVAQMQLAGELPAIEWGKALQTGFDAGIPMRYQIEIGARATTIVASEQTERTKDGVLDKIGETLHDLKCEAFPKLPDCPPDGASLDPTRHLLDPRDPSSKDYRLHQQIETGVARIDAEKGRTFDTISERVTMSTLADAKAAGMVSADHVVLNEAGKRARDDGSWALANTSLIVIQGQDPYAPEAKRAVTMLADAAQRPVEESLQRVNTLNQQQTLALAQQPASPTLDDPSRGFKIMYRSVHTRLDTSENSPIPLRRGFRFWPGRLTGGTVTHKRSGMPDVVGSTWFGYAMTGPKTGLLNEERIQPNGNVHEDLRNVYTLDDYGNRIASFVCGQQVADCRSSNIQFNLWQWDRIHRYSRQEYDFRGRSKAPEMLVAARSPRRQPMTRWAARST